MIKTAVISSSVYLQHDTGKNHPESADRLRTITDEIGKHELVNKQCCKIISPEKASVEEVEFVHGMEYIRLVEAVCRSGGGLLDLQDTVVSQRSFEVALHAVGGTLKSVNLVMEGKFKNAFALIRPPGHHAGKFRACGFCVFNNVAIAAEHIRRNYGLKKVAVLDIDAHHGNGTQEIFYETDEVLYISLHEDPSSFPGTGFMNETGKGKGSGYTVNIPLPFGTRDKTYIQAMKEIVLPIMAQYKPEFVLVSAGFDGHYADPVGNLSLSATCYQQIYEMLLRMADTCNGRIVSVLEGGYSLNHIGKLVAMAISQMTGTSYAIRARPKKTKSESIFENAKILKEIKRVQKAFWSFE